MKNEKIKCYICKRYYEEEEMSYSKSYCKSCYSDYKKAWNNSNKEHIRAYRKLYYQENKELIKAYNKRYDGYYIYMFLDETGYPLYIGATKNFKCRASAHLTYNSHIADKLALNEWETLEFADLTDIVYNLEELHFIENYLIEMYEPSYNSTLNIIKAVSSNRAIELLDIAQDLKFHFHRENEQKKCFYKLIGVNL